MTVVQGESRVGSGGRTGDELRLHVLDASRRRRNLQRRACGNGEDAEAGLGCGGVRAESQRPAQEQGGRVGYRRRNLWL
jgi:hypothetical protein